MTAANRHSATYLALWLDIADLTAEDSDGLYDARNVFKHLKQCRIGQNLPAFWTAWANLERRLGNDDKAAVLSEQAASRSESSSAPLSATRPPHPPLSVGRRRPLGPAQRALPDPQKSPHYPENHPDVEHPKPKQNTVNNSPGLVRHHAAVGVPTPARGDLTAGVPKLSQLGACDSPEILLSIQKTDEYRTDPILFSPRTSPPEKEKSIPEVQPIRKDSPLVGSSSRRQYGLSSGRRVISNMEELPSRRLERRREEELMREELRREQIRHEESRREELRRENQKREQQIREERIKEDLEREERLRDERRREEREINERELLELERRKEREYMMQRLRAEASAPSPGPSSASGSRRSNDSAMVNPAYDENYRSRKNQKQPIPRKSPFITRLSSEKCVDVNGRSYLILDVVGKGGSSKVYKVLSLEMKIVALKHVKVNTDSTTFGATLESYANEIELLKKLRGRPHIVQLYDYEVKREEGTIQLIMEYGDIDLAKLLSNRARESNGNDNFPRTYYWEQMLEAVHTIHEARIVHGDLKPANFLFVSGALKLIDFGIAKAIQAEDTTKILRDTQIGTPNYMSPEALMAEDEYEGDIYGDDIYGSRPPKKSKPQYRVGRASDIWSLGCILYQMVYGRTPFAHIRKIMQKLQCIPDPEYPISYPEVYDDYVLEVLHGCLQRDPSKRMSIPTLLKHRYICKESGVESASSVKCDARTSAEGVIDQFLKVGYEMKLYGERISFRRGDTTWKRLVDDIVEGLKQKGCDLGLSAVKDRNRAMTPTSSGVTHHGTRTGTGTRTRTTTNPYY